MNDITFWMKQVVKEKKTIKRRNNPLYTKFHTQLVRLPSGLNHPVVV